jgi:septal ring factor EnvC (AmiA/AmiB activator)
MDSIKERADQIDQLELTLKSLETEVLKLNGNLKAEKALSKSLADENKMIKSDLQVSKQRIIDLQDQVKRLQQTSTISSLPLDTKIG